MGKINTLYLYLDDTYKSNLITDSLMYYFNQPYLLTPNMSPAIDITKYDFDLFKEGRSRLANNLAIINIQEDSPFSTYVKQQLGETAVAEALAGKQMALVRVTDVNAQPQQLFYLLSNGVPNINSEKLRHQLQDYVHTIIRETTLLDNKRILSTFSDRRSRVNELLIEDKFGISLWLPRDYELMMEHENFIWFIHETDELYSNIVVYKANMNNEQPLGDQVMDIRDSFGKYVTTNRENSRMTTHVESKPIPIQREIKIDSTDVIETRGLWKMVNDRLGGGFVNYTLKNNRGEIISVDGFVYYSEDDKRRQMRNIDAILSTVKIGK